jgi:hypothetical protein
VGFGESEVTKNELYSTKACRECKEKLYWLEHVIKMNQRRAYRKVFESKQWKAKNEMPGNCRRDGFPGDENAEMK